MAYFIKRNNGKLLNILLVQNVLLRDTNIVYKMKNGETYEEVYESLEEAQTRLSNIQLQLISAGSGSSDEELRAQITNLNVQIIELNNQNKTLESDIENTSNLLDEINGEVI